MNRRAYKWGLAAVAAVMLFGVSRVQWYLTADREALGLNPYGTGNDELKGAPPVLAMTTVALGGFRGLISNLLWMRASNLQDQDKYFEMVQLADWITKLEPHFAMVWQVQAWNMAFNISVKFNDPADRWRWVKRGIELLRDEGLKYNPYDVPMHHDLAYLFEFKMGGNMDDAQNYYKVEWAHEMENIFKSDKPDWEELIHPTTDDARQRAALLRDKYKMDVELMKQVDDKYGPLEWRLPEAHAIYWAVQGLRIAKQNAQRVDPDAYIQLERIVYQSMHLAFDRGRLREVPAGTNGQQILDFEPNLAIIGKANESYEEAINSQGQKFQGDLQAAHRYLLLDAIFYFQQYGREADAQRWFDYLKQKYPNKAMLVGQPDTLPDKMTVDDYAMKRFEEEFKTLGQYKTEAMIAGLERQSLLSLATSQPDEDHAAALDAMARRVFKSYEDKIDKSIGSSQDITNRLQIPTPAKTRQDMLKDLLSPGTLPREAQAILSTEERVSLPAATNTNSNPADGAGGGR